MITPSSPLFITLETPVREVFSNCFKYEIYESNRKDLTLEELEFLLEILRFKVKALSAMTQPGKDLIYWLEDKAEVIEQISKELKARKEHN